MKDSMHFVFQRLQFSLSFLLFIVFSLSLIISNDDSSIHHVTSLLPLVWASQSFDTNDIDRDYDEDGTQGIAGLYIIRGNGMIIGTDEDDFIVGSFFDDTIVAREGDDEVQSGQGIDQLYGDDGKDSLQGGADNDQIFGQAGSDNLVGGLDDDLLAGGSRDDHLYGGFGDDQLKGGSGADYFNCGPDVDEVKDYNPSEGDILESNCDIINTRK
jgi:Ca2+-binding RTX toxin-like protein